MRLYEQATFVYVNWKEMKKRVWKPHPREPFLLSDKGEVYSLLTRQIMKQVLNDWGYYVISGGLAVHKMVYEAFKGPIPPRMIVDHIDRNKKHNSPDNLRLLTVAQNALNRPNSLPNPFKYEP